MTQEALKLALDWAEAHGEIVFAGGGMSAVNKMNSWVAAIKEALAKEKTLQALHSENERLGLYKDAYAEQEPEAWMYQEYRDDDQFGWRDEIQFVQPPNDPNYFRNIVPVYTTPPQRTWVGLAAEDRLTAKYMQDAPDGIEAVIDYIEAKLKERNDHSI
jgi:hypothetical protein